MWTLKMFQELEDKQLNEICVQLKKFVWPPETVELP